MDAKRASIEKLTRKVRQSIDHKLWRYRFRCRPVNLIFELQQLKQRLNQCKWEFNKREDYSLLSCIHQKLIIENLHKASLKVGKDD